MRLLGSCYHDGSWLGRRLRGRSPTRCTMGQVGLARNAAAAPGNITRAREVNPTPSAQPTIPPLLLMTAHRPPTDAHRPGALSRRTAQPLATNDATAAFFGVALAPSTRRHDDETGTPAGQRDARLMGVATVVLMIYSPDSCVQTGGILITAAVGCGINRHDRLLSRAL